MAARRRRRCDQHAVTADHLAGLLVVVLRLLWHNRRHDFLAQSRPDDSGTASCLGGTGVAVAVPGRGDEPEDPERRNPHRTVQVRNGKLVCDDFAGYKAGFEQGITEIGCMAHARRKFFDLHVANKSQLAEQALHSIGGLYEVERQARDMSNEDRWRIRQEMAVPISKTLHEWMLAQRDLVPNGSATAKALDYSLKRWVALTRYLDDGAVPIDNNQVENQIRPWALGRSNWLFAGSLRSGKRAAAIMGLIQSARMNGHDPYAYLKDVLTRLPTQRASEIGQLLPHQWVPA